MKITINNFRCYKKKVIEFQDGKITLLCGKSGIGKTTILNAIKWCLYGSIRNVEPMDKPQSKTKVIVEFDKIKIMRSKKPNKIEFTHEDTLSVGDCAQEIINTMFGECDDWLSCCFVEQGKINNFINKSKKDKITFLYKLCMFSEDITDYMDRINNKSKKLKTDHKIIDAEYKGLSHGFEEINFNEDYILDDIDIKNEELINLENELKKLKIELDNYNKYIWEKDRLEKNIKEKKLISYDLPKKAKCILGEDDELNNLIIKLDEYNVWKKEKDILSSLDISEDDGKEFDKKYINDQMKIENKYNLLIDLCKKYNLKLEWEIIENRKMELNDIISNINLFTKRNTYIDKKDNLNKEINKLKNNKKEYKEIDIEIYDSEIKEIEDQIEKEKEELIKMEKEHTKLNCPECNKNILLDFESMELLTI